MGISHKDVENCLTLGNSSFVLLWIALREKESLSSVEAFSVPPDTSTEKALIGSFVPEIRNIAIFFKFQVN